MAEFKTILTKDAPARECISSFNPPILPKMKVNRTLAVGPYSQAVATSNTIYCSGQYVSSLLAL